MSFHEDRKHEFKAFARINLSTLVPLAYEYMCAFLNCEGGTLYIGIDDDAYVTGVYLSNKDIDRLLLEIDAGCKTKFSPPLLPQRYRVKFVPVKGERKQRQLIDYYVIEIEVIRDRDEQHRYLYNRECYMRMNASNHRLLASEIIESERMRYQKKHGKEVELQRAILGQDKRYFEVLSEKELKNIQKNLEATIAVIGTVLRERAASERS